MTQHRRWRTTVPLQERAQQLRQEQTPAERKLWSRLRRKQLYGLKFPRQHPIGRFVVDFCCLSQALVVEVDGDSHSTQVAYDQERTAWLEDRGYRVIRFTNQQVERQIDAVLDEIARVCGVAGEEPPPQPSPGSREREKKERPRGRAPSSSPP